MKSTIRSCQASGCLWPAELCQPTKVVLPGVGELEVLLIHRPHRGGLSQRRREQASAAGAPVVKLAYGRATSRGSARHSID